MPRIVPLKCPAGTVTNKRTGGLVAGATVMSYGPPRPESGATVIYTVQNDRHLEVAEGQTKRLNFSVMPTH